MWKCHDPDVSYWSGQFTDLIRLLIWLIVKISIRMALPPRLSLPFLSSSLFFIRTPSPPHHTFLRLTPSSFFVFYSSLFFLILFSSSVVRRWTCSTGKWWQTWVCNLSTSGYNDEIFLSLMPLFDLGSFLTFPFLVFLLFLFLFVASLTCSLVSIYLAFHGYR